MPTLAEILASRTAPKKEKEEEKEKTPISVFLALYIRAAQGKYLVEDYEIFSYLREWLSPFSFSTYENMKPMKLYRNQRCEGLSYLLDVPAYTIQREAFLIELKLLQQNKEVL